MPYFKGKIATDLKTALFSQISLLPYILRIKLHLSGLEKFWDMI